MQEALKTLRGARSQEIYHMLGVAVVVGTARVSIAVILAVDHSALDSLLNLMDGEEMSLKTTTPGE